jgi:hypothetical protein
MSRTFGKKKEPPCEQCFPGIHERNNNAWEVYQTSSFGGMGLTVIDVLSVCDVFGIKEKDEILLKIRLLVGYLSEIEEEKDGTSDTIFGNESKYR